MSDGAKAARNWSLYVEDMIEFGERALSYVTGFDRESFFADGRTYDATLRNIQLIGEAATHVPGAVREAHQEIEWRKIIGTRNRVAHAYLGIDDDIVWDIVRTDIPNLLPKLRHLLDSAG